MSNFKRLKLPALHAVLTLFLMLRSRYKLGAKWDPISNPSPFDKPVDCSGAVRWIIYHASNCQVIMPDGSVNQRDWCEKMGFEKVPYSIACNDNSSAVYMAFIRPLLGKAGHVWLVRMRHTWESYGGHGPGVRDPKTTILRLRCYACYRIA